MEGESDFIVAKAENKKTRTRDAIIVASIKRNISLHSRVVRSKKIYTRKQKHQKDTKWQL